MERIIGEIDPKIYGVFMEPIHFASTITIKVYDLLEPDNYTAIFNGEGLSNSFYVFK